MNYYEQIFENLLQHCDKDNALREVVNIFLFRNTKINLPQGMNKTDLFFKSSFIQLLSKSDFEIDNFQWALAQYFRFGNVDKNLLSFFLNLDEENTVFAIRLSGIINNLEHSSWQAIEIKKDEFKQIKELYEVVVFLNNQYQQIQHEYQRIKDKWKWTHIDVIAFASLYLYEIVLIQHSEKEITIPYQIDDSTPIKQEDIFQALHFIITHAYKSTKLLTDNNLRPTFDSRLEPFLFTDQLTERKLKEYEEFKQLVAYQVELQLFDDFVFNSFSYNKDIKYIFQNGELKHSTNKKSYDFYAEKFHIFWFYWKWRGVKSIDKKLDKKNFEYWQKSNDPLQIMTAFADTNSAILLLKEIYGIDEIALSDEKVYDIFNTLFAINMQQQYYINSFIKPFLELYQIRQGNPLQILGIMTIGNFLTRQNFYPVVTGKKEVKARNMGNAWILEGSNNAKTKQMMQILDFWSCNLNEVDQDGYVEKPFYLLDGRIIQLPHRIGQQNIYGGIINYLRKLHKNRETLKQETDAMEKKLADLFLQKKCQIFCQYIPIDNAVGEIDLIVLQDNTILVIELKSTFLKTNLKEVYHYQNFTLKKASYQLDRKLAYVKDNYREFTNKPLASIKFYSWIVDTTLEADHQIFNQHLKVSLEEIIICLKNHQNFMSFFDNPEDFVNSDDNQESFNLQQFIEKIENNTFWEQNLANLKELEKSAVS